MSALDDVTTERGRQDAKWGEQNHPNGSGSDTRPLERVMLRGEGDGVTALDLSFSATRATDVAAAFGRVSWADILLEEVFEALAEDDPAALRVELIQVAAVAVQWVEAIDRKASA